MEESILSHHMVSPPRANTNMAPKRSSSSKKDKKIPTSMAPKHKSSSTKDDPHHRVSPPRATTQRASKRRSRHKKNKDILAKLMTKIDTFRKELLEDINNGKTFGDTSTSIWSTTLEDGGRQGPIYDDDVDPSPTLENDMILLPQLHQDEDLSCPMCNGFGHIMWEIGRAHV